MELRDDLAGLVEDVPSLRFKVDGRRTIPGREIRSREGTCGAWRVYLGRPRILGVEIRIGRHWCELKLRGQLPRVGPDSNRPLDRR